MTTRSSRRCLGRKGSTSPGRLLSRRLYRTSIDAVPFPANLPARSLARPAPMQPARNSPDAAVYYPSTDVRWWRPRRPLGGPHSNALPATTHANRRRRFLDRAGGPPCHRALASRAAPTRPESPPAASALIAASRTSRIPENCHRGSGKKAIALPSPDFRPCASMTRPLATARAWAQLFGARALTL